MIEYRKLHQTLDEWIFIKIAADIVDLPHHRPEYQFLVNEAKRQNIDKKEIPQWVLKELDVLAKKQESTITYKTWKWIQNVKIKISKEIENVKKSNWFWKKKRNP